MFFRSNVFERLADLHGHLAVLQALQNPREKRRWPFSAILIRTFTALPANRSKSLSFLIDAVQAGRGDLQDVGLLDGVFLVEQRADAVREIGAVVEGDPVRLIEEQAQNPLVALAAPLQVDDLAALLLDERASINVSISLASMIFSIKKVAQTEATFKVRPNRGANNHIIA